VTNILLAGLGGFVGAGLRYAIGLLALRVPSAPAFVLGTLAVNVIGCFLIGLLGGVSVHRGGFSDATRALVVGGVLGGFTTYSSFGFESFELFRSGDRALGALHIAAHLVLGLGAVYLGDLLGRIAGRPG
jgi:CrcB protein